MFYGHYAGNNKSFPDFVQKIGVYMNKQYIISIDGNYVRLWEDEKKIEVVSSIKEATFFDSEQIAYEVMLKNKQVFYTSYNLFYKIECVVWGEDV